VAIYHLSIKIISRGKGKSAVAAAAYRSGTIIKNNYDGLTHDYTKKGGVVHTEILLPDNAPSEYTDRAVLWNAVEKIENARNSQLAREIEIALPAELTLMQNKSLVREYVKRNFVEHGMCADVCIHDTDNGNPHAHIMLTMRPIEQGGSWSAKSKKEYVLDMDGEKIRLASGEYKSRKISVVDWNDQTKAEEWREAWATAANRYLEKLGHSERIDHRSFVVCYKGRFGLNATTHMHTSLFAVHSEDCCERREVDIIFNRQGLGGFHALLLYFRFELDGEIVQLKMVI